jgi:hypothetical protein
MFALGTEQQVSGIRTDFPRQINIPAVAELARHGIRRIRLQAARP